MTNPYTLPGLDHLRPAAVFDPITPTPKPVVDPWAAPVPSDAQSLRFEIVELATLLNVPQGSDDDEYEHWARVCTTLATRQSPASVSTLARAVTAALDIANDDDHTYGGQLGERLITWARDAVEATVTALDEEQQTQREIDDAFRR